MSQAVPRPAQKVHPSTDESNWEITAAEEERVSISSLSNKYEVNEEISKSNSNRSKSVVISYSACSDIGERAYQEDRLVHIEDFNPLIPASNKAVDRKIQRSFFAVYDGHGGAGCSTYLANSLHLDLARHPQIGTDPA
ncbi:unnamed protein product, partial [Heterosigma akashiwo]